MDCDGHIYEERLPAILNQIQSKQQQIAKLKNEILKYISTNTKLVEKNKELQKVHNDKQVEVDLHMKTIAQIKEKSFNIESSIVKSNPTIILNATDTPFICRLKGNLN